MNQKNRKRFFVVLTTFVALIFLIDIILFLKPLPIMELIFALSLFLMILIFFYRIVRKLKFALVVNSKGEEVIPDGNLALKKNEITFFNDEDIRREKLMVKNKAPSKISQEELEEFFKRPMSHTTEYKIKDFVEGIEKSKNDIFIQD